MDDLKESEINSADSLSVDEEDNNDVVILEVFSVGGRQSTKLIEPPAKKKKVESSGNAKDSKEKSKLQIGADSASGETSTSTVKQNIVNGMPIMVKEGDKSRLMYLYSTPQGSQDARVPSPASQLRRTNEDMLIDRLKLRIKELETKIADQRETYKLKMSKAEEKHRNKVEWLTRTIAQPVKCNPPPKIPKTVRSDSKTCNCPKLSPQDVVYGALKERFSRNQIRALIEKDPMIRWDDSELLKAYTLRCISYGAYIFLRDQLKYPLPSTKYLSRWLGRHQLKADTASAEKTLDDVGDEQRQTTSEQMPDQVLVEDDDNLQSVKEVSIEPSNAKSERKSGKIHSPTSHRTLNDGEERYIFASHDDSSPNVNSAPKLVRAVRIEDEKLHYITISGSADSYEEVYIVRESDDDTDPIESDHCYQLTVHERSAEH